MTQIEQGGFLRDSAPAGESLGPLVVLSTSAPLPAGAATEATLSAAVADLGSILAKLSSDPATQTTLASILTKLNASLAVTGPLTDTQLRASAVPVSGTVTATTGGLTDTQLRASAVPVSGTVSTGGLTDTQLRAAAVPVSGPATDTQLRATPLPVSGTVTVSNPTTNPETGLAKDATLTTRLPTALSTDGDFKVVAVNQLVPREYDHVEIDPSSVGPTAVRFKQGTTLVRTLTLSYTGSDLTGVVAS